MSDPSQYDTMCDLREEVILEKGIVLLFRCSLSWDIASHSEIDEFGNWHIILEA